jgi:hypothetical protein
MTTFAESARLCLALSLVIYSGCRTISSESIKSGHDITDVFVEVARLKHDSMSNGDTWDHIWADDGTLYSFACDGRGYGVSNRNVNFNKLAGDSWDHLTGSIVQSMDGYGKGGQQIPNHSNWKVNGADCIDGVFYAFIANNWYGNQNAYDGEGLDLFLRQTVNNMSLIKSTDRGLTWSRDVKVNIEHPMWTNKMFSTAFFFKFGQNGGATRQDDQDKYVYAISNDGYWNCGSAFYLGRVLRSKIGDLNASAWEYSSNGGWTPDLAHATPVPGFPGGLMKCTVGSPIWLASLKRYVTVTWYDPGTTAKWYYLVDVTFAFYQAEHPWGPWSYIGEKSADQFIADRKDRIYRWYGPSLNPKFITDNPDGNVTATMIFSGSTWEDEPASLYKNNSSPVTFYTRPLPRLRAAFNDPAAQYFGDWKYQGNRGYGDFNDDIHVTTTPGAYCDFSFAGEGIEILSEKYRDMGDVEVVLDGNSQGISHLYQDPMPRLYQIPCYRKMDLTPGKHTIRIINCGNDSAFCIVDGFRVYGKDSK